MSEVGSQAPLRRPFYTVTPPCRGDAFIIPPRYYCSKLSTCCGSWLTCASIDVPLWLSICSFTNSIIVEAMSASRILLSAAVRFVIVVVRFSAVYSNEFWYAPIFARCSDTRVMALSSTPRL